MSIGYPKNVDSSGIFIIIERIKSCSLYIAYLHIANKNKHSVFLARQISLKLLTFHVMYIDILSRYISMVFGRWSDIFKWYFYRKIYCICLQ